MKNKWISIADRQRREIDYHRVHASRYESLRRTPVSLDVVTSENRRWWNAYWTTYDILRVYELRNKRVLVPGCGFGDDAVRLSRMGAQVYAFDISPDVIEIARDRSKKFEYDRVEFKVMATENLEYESNFFDFVLCMDVLHHVDIPTSIRQFQRVLKRGGRIVGDELYTHSAIERLIRNNYLVDRIIYPRMQKYIYGTGEPYITEDEHKIDEWEFQTIRDALKTLHVEYFDFFVGRFVPERRKYVSKIDRTIARSVGALGRYFASRIVFDGEIRK